MAVLCPACGKTSLDHEFCDHCNADLAPPGDGLPPRQCALATAHSTTHFELSDEQCRLLARGDQSVTLANETHLHRLHWVARFEPCRARLEQRLAQTTWALPAGALAAEGAGAWVVVDAAAERYTPWRMPAEEPLDELARLLSGVKPIVDVLEELHLASLAWLTFDPEELEWGEGGRLRITNLDLGVFPFQQCPERITVRPAFAAPEVVHFKPEAIGPRTDVFHLAMFCWYWLARRLPDGFTGAGLDSFHYELPPLRIFQPQLPEGIDVVLRQGAALEPGQRFTSPLGLFTALQEAVARAFRRRRSTAPIRWEIGQHTRPGRTKSALNRANEDQVMTHRFTEPERALVAVADGISTCDVGSGALASLITTMVLENMLTGDVHAEAFPQVVRELCRRGAQTLVDWAVEKGYRDQLAEGADLMGTTLTAGWLEARHLCLANLGDSRAYLIDGPLVEQLSVDGDLGNYMLRHGTPPEQLRDLGLMAKALRECIGGCTLDEQRRVIVQEDSCIPTISQWPLLPGDIIVLCSDGLVDEGTFLEPEMLGELVRAYRELPAQDLADRLVDAADALQRLPTFLEPEGFGDNISCIVVKIHEG